MLLGMLLQTSMQVAFLNQNPKDLNFLSTGTAEFINTMLVF